MNIHKLLIEESIEHPKHVLNAFREYETIIINHKKLNEVEKLEQLLEIYELKDYLIEGRLEILKQYAKQYGEKAKQYGEKAKQYGMDALTKFKNREKAKQYGEKAKQYGKQYGEKAKQYGKQYGEKAKQYGKQYGEKAKQYGKQYGEKAKQYGMDALTKFKNREKSKGIYSHIRGSSRNIENITRNVDKTTKNAGQNIENITRNVNKGLKGVGAVGAGATALSVLYLARKSYRNKKLGSCSKFNGKEEIMCKIRALDQYNSFLKNQIGKCRKTTNPSLCQEKIRNEITKTKEKREKLLMKINKY
jgi:hypothetical protein